MTLKVNAFDEPLRQSLDLIAHRTSRHRLTLITSFNRLFGVPVVTVALNEKIESGYVEIKNQPFCYSEFRHSRHADSSQRLTDDTLYRTLPLKPSVAHERTETPSTFSLRGCKSEWLPARFASPINRWPNRARQRAIVIASGVGSWYGKGLATLRADFRRATTKAFPRTINSWTAAALIERKSLSAFTASQRGVPVTLPSYFNSARTAVWATETTRLNRLRFLSSARNTVGVNVVCSQWRDLQTQVARLVEPLGCFRTSAACSF